MHECKFDYYYGHEAEQYSFYRIPKALFTDEAFSGLSCEAKVLYGLMLDRMGLSLKNNWVDEDNRVYIYFTLEDAMETMRCGQDKGVKLFSELDGIKGIGLIERKKQGMGRPARIYVKNFTTNRNGGPSNDGNPKNQGDNNNVVRTTEKPKSLLPENRSQDYGKPEVKTTEKPKSSLRKNRGQDFGKTDPNYTDNNKTEINDTEISDIDFNKNNFNDTGFQSIRQSINPSPSISKPFTSQQYTDPYEVYRQIIKDNIAYDCLISDGYRYHKNDIDEIVELMLEVVCTTKKRLRINGEDMPADTVKNRFLKLDLSHIEYALERMSKNTNKIHNIRNYLLTTLYNSFTTINHYYRAEVNHDFYG